MVVDHLILLDHLHLKLEEHLEHQLLENLVLLNLLHYLKRSRNLAIKDKSRPMMNRPAQIVGRTRAAVTPLAGPRGSAWSSAGEAWGACSKSRMMANAALGTAM